VAAFTKDIAVLAKRYFDRYGDHALMLVDDDISRAIGAGGWDDVLKWQRVKERLRRLQALDRPSFR